MNFRSSIAVTSRAIPPPRRTIASPIWAIQPASPVADALVTRGTPFVFATGYGSVPEPYRGRPMLTKPFQINGLKRLFDARGFGGDGVAELPLSESHSI
jgi:hypothetical protein